MKGSHQRNRHYSCKPVRNGFGGAVQSHRRMHEKLGHLQSGGLRSAHSRFLSLESQCDTEENPYQVIIDNMMNLQVFFASYELTGNETLVEMAMSHADKTMVNHIRPDGGSYHVVVYNASTGAVIERITSQGYANNRYIHLLHH